MIQIFHCQPCPTQAPGGHFCRASTTTTRHRTRMMDCRGQGQPLHPDNQGSPLRVSKLPAPSTSLHTNRSSRCYPIFDHVESLLGRFWTDLLRKYKTKIDGRASTLSTWTLNVHMAPGCVVSPGPRACGGPSAKTSQKPQFAWDWGLSTKLTKLTPGIGKIQVVCVWDGKRTGSSSIPTSRPVRRLQA